MPRRLTNGLTLLSAVVCVGSLLLLGRSWFRSDQVGVSIGQGRLWLTVIEAQIIVAWDPSAVLPPSFESYDAARMRPARDWVWRRSLTGIRALGVGWNLTGSQDERLILPLWLLPLLTAIAPVRWLLRRNNAGRGFPIAGTTESEGRAEGEVRVTK